VRSAYSGAPPGVTAAIEFSDWLRVDVDWPTVDSASSISAEPSGHRTFGALAPANG